MKQERQQRSTSEEGKALQSRLKAYGEMVKTNFTPQIDEKKVKEAMSRREQMDQPKSMIA